MRARGPAGALFLLALLLFPFALGSPGGAVTGHFTFTAAQLSGDWASPQPEPGFAAVAALDPGTRFGWTLTADALILNWTLVRRYEVMRPDDPSTPYVYVNQGPARQWDEPTPATVASGESRSRASNLLVVGLAASAPTIAVRASSLTVEEQGQAWYAGPDSSPTASGGQDDTRVAFQPPAGFLEAGVADATLRVYGNVSVAVWDAWVVLQEPGSPRRVESGRSDPSPVPPPGFRDSEYRLLWIRAQNATLTLQALGPAARIAAPALAVTGTGQALFSGAEGSLRDDEREARLLGQPVRAEGDQNLWFRRGLAEIPNAEIWLDQGSVDYGDGSMRTTRAAQTTNTFETWSWWFVLPLIAPLVVIGARRWRRVTLAEVELAMLAGDSRRGVRLSRRLVAREPGNADALFLYASSLLETGRFRRLVERVEPRAEKLVAADRRGVAYVLAVASQAAGDTRRARRWAREAAVDPLLRDRLAEDGLYEGRPRRTPGQSGYV